LPIPEVNWPLELADFQAYDSNVLALSPTFVENAIPETTDLLDRAKAGDAGAFGEICGIYEDRLLRQAMALCGNASAAEDLAQDTLVEAWKSLRRYNGRCQFFTWLCTILLHRHHNTVRQKRPMPFSSFAVNEDSEFQRGMNQLADDRPLPDHNALLRDQADIVRKCICALSPKQQEVIHLRFFVDDSLEGIAAALGCSIGTVKSRLFNALENLRGMEDMRGQFRDVAPKTPTL
jgi:RNA polymerase sigma-70 factor (ECF subfamily)